MEPLLIQHHIAKTAGTSLRQVTRANYAPHEVADLERLFGAGPIPREYRWSEALDGSGRAYRELDPRRKAELRCVVGHAVPMLLAVVDDRPIQAFTLLRDPVDRVVSLLAHAERQAEAQNGTAARSEMATGARAVWAPMVQAMRDRRLDLEGVYRALADGDADEELLWLFRPLFNEQAGAILMSVMDPREMPLTSDRSVLAPYLERALEVLERRYVVGTQDRFSQSVRLFADRFGWRTVFIPRVNVRGRTPSVDEETRSVIRAHNWVDTELHRRYSERLAHLPEVSRFARLHGAAYQGARARLARARRALAGASATATVAA